jgi:biopolymer transport protein ExbD
MITRPLELEARLSRAPRDLDVMHWVSVAAVMLFFSLAGSRFVLAPGLFVGNDAYTLPRPGGATQAVRTAPLVVSFRRDNMILFGGGRYQRLEELRGPLEALAREHPNAALLVVAEEQVSMVAMSRLAELAVSVGFTGLQIAGPKEPPGGATPPK